MKEGTLRRRLIVGAFIALAFGISLVFRLVLPYGQAFNDSWVKFTSIDAYFYQRIIDVTAFNFPHLMDFDPYFVYPGGRALNNIFFPSWITAALIWVLTGGAPTQQAVNTISAFLPGIFAALTVIPAYFIGKALFGYGAGIIAALLTAVFPGEYLGRSIIGMTDTHVVETLLTTAFMAFIILAIKAAQDSGMTSLGFREWNRKICTRPLIYSALAGLFLGMYFLSWMGALLFAFIYAVYLIIQGINDHLRQQPLDYLGAMGMLPAFIALIIFLPLSPGAIHSASLAGAFIVPAGLVIISRLMNRFKLRPFYFPLTLVACAGIGLAVLYLASPQFFKGALGLFRIFAPTGASAITTVEMQPFLDPNRTASLNTAIPWGNFTTSFFLFSKVAFPGLAFISLAILIYLFIRRHNPEGGYLRPVIWVLGILFVIMMVLLFAGYGQSLLAFIPAVALLGLLFFPADNNQRKHWLLLFIWTLTMLLLTLAQRRFAYYLVINIALLSAYLSWQVIWLAGARKIAQGAEKETPPAMDKPETKKEKARKTRARHGSSLHVLWATVSGIIAFFVVFFPNIMKAKAMTTAEEAPYAPSDAWVASLLWMKENTPEPFGDPQSYYRIFPAPAKGEEFAYPETAYGVTSWWDYGYWITQIAHRLPSANPAQEPRRIINVANLFLSEDEPSAKRLLEAMDTAYIIIDNLTTVSKFWAVATWAGYSESKYYDLYFVDYQGKLQPVYLFYPEYYRTLVVRLFNFDGRAVSDTKAAVITWVDKKDGRGAAYKQITEVREFASYQQAEDYLKAQKAINCAIVGTSPFISPIRLEAVPDFRLVYSSEEGTSVKNVGFVPEVKVFEYTGRSR